MSTDENTTSTDENTMSRNEENQNDEDTEESHLRTVKFYRDKMDLQPIHSALKSFNVDSAARMSGVYEIHRFNKVACALHTNTKRPHDTYSLMGWCLSRHATKVF